MQLAQIDAELRRQGLDVQRYGIDSGANVAIMGQNTQNDQFLRELALREWRDGEDNRYRWANLPR
jgi:mevalonate pyrophosphate decarboxylase